MTYRLLRGALLVAALLLAARPIVAGEATKSQAHEHFERAVELVDEGSLAQAAKEFERAYELSPHYRVLWNLGQVYAALDRPVEALDVLERYQREAGEGIEADRRAKLDQALAELRGRVGEVAVTVTPAGAGVTIDGRPVGKAPLDEPVRLAPGKHEVSVRLAGHEQAKATVTVAGGGQATVKIALQPVQPPPAGSGQLVIECPVPGVRVGVDGSSIGQTPFASPVGIPAGRHEISFARPGYAMRPKPVQVVAARPAMVACDATVVRPVPVGLAGSLSLSVDEDEARVLVDGEEWPVDGRLPAGPHVLEVEKAGFVPATINFTLAAGEARQLHVDLVPVESGPGEAPADEAGPPRALAYLSGGVGLALGGVAIGLAVWNDGRFDEWQTEQEALDQAYGSGPVHADLLDRQSANDDLADSISTMDGVSIGLGIAGGALAVAAVVLFVTSEDGSADETMIAAPLPGGGYAGWMTRW